MFRVMGVITSDRKHFSNTDPLCIAPTQICVWGVYFRIFGYIATI